MNPPDTFDVAVIGAGIAGASLAWRLAAQRSVLLLERESQPGCHATGRSAAMFMQSYGPPAVRALTRASLSFYTAPPDGFTEQALLQARGALYLAAPGQQALLAPQYAQLAATCPELEQLDQDRTLALVGCLRPERVVLRAQAEVLAAHRRGALWELELPGRGSVFARVVVNAAGAWADQVAALFGAPAIGLVPHRRSAFTFKPPAGMPVAHWPVVASVDESFYFKPDAGVLLGSPANADPTVPHDVVAEELDVATGIHHIEAATTLTITRPLRAWAGLRSFVPDGEMVIGWDARREGFFWLAGQGGYGIQSAPGASELAAALLLGQPMSAELARHGVDPDALSPRRLGAIIATLSAMPHIQTIRIHSRVPVADPDRLTEALAAAMDTNRSLWLVVHANHAREFTPAASAALLRVRTLGIPVLGQSVLLRGVNDSSEALEGLFRAMIANRVKPYYLHQLDPAPGTARFLVPIEEGRALLETLRGRVTGLAWPTYVLDIPGGFGKVPVGPDYLHADGSVRDIFGIVHPA